MLYCILCADVMFTGQKKMKRRMIWKNKTEKDQLQTALCDPWMEVDI